MSRKTIYDDRIFKTTAADRYKKFLEREKARSRSVTPDPPKQSSTREPGDAAGSSSAPTNPQAPSPTYSHRSFSSLSVSTPDEELRLLFPGSADSLSHDSSMNGQDGRGENPVQSLHTPGTPKVLSGTSDQVPDEWLRMFDLWGKAKNLSDEAKANQLPLFLSGLALEVYWSIPEEERADYNHLKAVLCEKLAPPGLTRLNAGRLYESRQESNETSQAFSSRLSSMFRLAYPNSDPGMREKLLCDLFVRGLRDEIKYGLLNSSPATFEEAVGQARQIETNLRLIPSFRFPEGEGVKGKEAREGRSSRSARRVSFSEEPGPPDSETAMVGRFRNEILEAVNRLASMQERQEARQSSTSERLERLIGQVSSAPGVGRRERASDRFPIYNASGPPPPQKSSNPTSTSTTPPRRFSGSYSASGLPICYYCGKEGHMKFQCRKRQRDMENGRQRGMGGRSPQRREQWNNGRSGGSERSSGGPSDQRSPWNAPWPSRPTAQSPGSETAQQTTRRVRAYTPDEWLGLDGCENESSCLAAEGASYAVGMVRACHSPCLDEGIECRQKRYGWACYGKECEGGWAIDAGVCREAMLTSVALDKECDGSNSTRRSVNASFPSILSRSRRKQHLPRGPQVWEDGEMEVEENEETVPEDLGNALAPGNAGHVLPSLSPPQLHPEHDYPLDLDQFKDLMTFPDETNANSFSNAGLEDGVGLAGPGRRPRQGQGRRRPRPGHPYRVQRRSPLLPTPGSRRRVLLPTPPNLPHPASPPSRWLAVFLLLLLAPVSVANFNVLNSTQIKDLGISGQICTQGRSAYYLSLPKLEDEPCSRLRHDHDVSTQLVELFGPRTTPVVTTAALCTHIQITICAWTSVFGAVNLVNRTVMEIPTPSLECKLIGLEQGRTKTWHGRSLSVVSPFFYHYKEIERLPNQYCCHTTCATTESFSVEIGNVSAIFPEQAYSNLAVVSCPPSAGQCSTGHGTLVWPPGPFSDLCPYQALGGEEGMVSGNRVVVPKRAMAVTLSSWTRAPCVPGGWLTDQGLVIKLQDESVVSLESGTPISSTSGSGREASLSEQRTWLRQLVQGQVDPDLQGNLKRSFLQYLMTTEFDRIYYELCMSRKRHIEVVRALSLVSATSAVRALLGTDAVAATLAAPGVFAISACSKVKLSSVFLDKKYEGNCYANIPVLTAQSHLLFFISGSTDLTHHSHQVPCSSRKAELLLVGGSLISAQGGVRAHKFSWSSLASNFSTFVFDQPGIGHASLSSILLATSSLAAIHDRQERMQAKLSGVVNHLSDLSFDPQGWENAATDTVDWTRKEFLNLSDGTLHFLGKEFAVAKHWTRSILAGPLQVFLNLLIGISVLVILGISAFCGLKHRGRIRRWVFSRTSLIRATGRHAKCRYRRRKGSVPELVELEGVGYGKDESDGRETSPCARKKWRWWPGSWAGRPRTPTGPRPATSPSPPSPTPRPSTTLTTVTVHPPSPVFDEEPPQLGYDPTEFEIGMVRTLLSPDYPCESNDDGGESSDEEADCVDLEHLVIYLNGVRFEAQLDSGAAGSFCTLSQYKKITGRTEKDLKPSRIRFTSLSGHRLPILGRCQLVVRLPGQVRSFPFCFHVTSDESQSKILIGISLMKASKQCYELDFGRNTLRIGNYEQKLYPTRRRFDPHSLKVEREVILPASARVRLICRVPSSFASAPLVYTPPEKLPPGIFTCPMIVETVGKDNKVPIWFWNVGKAEVKFGVGHAMGSIEIVSLAVPRKGEGGEQSTSCVSQARTTPPATPSTGPPPPCPQPGTQCFDYRLSSHDLQGNQRRWRDLAKSGNFPPLCPSSPSLCLNHFPDSFPERLIPSVVGSVSICPQLPEEQKQKLGFLVSKFCKKGLFGHEDHLASQRCKIFEADIKFSDSEPIFSAPYRVSPYQQEIIDNEVNKLLSKSIIYENPTSRWASPVLLVPKRGEGGKISSYRMVVDFRLANRAILPSPFPIGDTKTLLQKVAGHELNSCLDLQSAFYSAAIKKECQEITTFTTQKGLFSFACLPMGLKTSPNCWSSVISLAVLGFDSSVHCFLDDIAIVSDASCEFSAFDHHFRTLEVLFFQLLSIGVTINPKKVKLGFDKLRFLGMEISKEGIRPDYSRISALKEFPSPTNVKQVRSFAGMTNFFRDFIFRYSAKMSPIYAVLRQKGVFKWTQECEKALRAVIADILSPSCFITYPRYTKSGFRIFSDASSSGMGGILLCPDSDGTWKVCSFASRRTTSAEAKSSGIELEMSCLAYLLTSWKYLIFGFPIRVYADAQSLRFVLRSKIYPNSKLAKAALIISEFDVTICHIPGSSNCVADCLSRIDDGTENSRITLKDWLSKISASSSHALDGEVRICDGEVRDVRHAEEGNDENEHKGNPQCTHSPSSPSQFHASPSTSTSQPLVQRRTTLPTTYNLDKHLEAPFLSDQTEGDRVVGRGTPWMSRIASILAGASKVASTTAASVPRPSATSRVPHVPCSSSGQPPVTPQGSLNFCCKTGICPPARKVKKVGRTEVDGGEDDNLPPYEWSLEEIRQAQRGDKFCSQLAAKVKAGAECERFEFVLGCLVTTVNFTRRLWSLGNLPPPTNLLVLPERYIERCIVWCHESVSEGGHAGMDSVKYRILRYWWFPLLTTRVRQIVINCTSCMRNRPIRHPYKPNQTSLPEGRTPFSCLSGDFFGPLISCSCGERHAYVLGLRCNLTKFMVLFPTPDCSSESWVRCFSEFFDRYTVCQQCLLDQGAAFVSAISRNLCASYGVQLRWTPSHKPQCNPAETLWSMIGQRLSQYIGDQHREWCKLVTMLGACLNDMPRPSMAHLTPHFLVFGQYRRSAIAVLSLPSRYDEEPSFLELRHWRAMWCWATVHSVVQRQKQRAHKYFQAKSQLPILPTNGSLVFVSTLPPTKIPRNLCRKFWPRNLPFIVRDIRGSSVLLADYNDPNRVRYAHLSQIVPVRDLVQPPLLSYPDAEGMPELANRPQPPPTWRSLKEGKDEKGTGAEESLPRPQPQRYNLRPRPK